MAKTSKREMHVREKDILNMIGQGMKRGEITRILSGKYSVSDQSIGRQYDKIVNSWIEEDKDKLDETRAQYIFQLQQLYIQAYNSGHWKVASDIIEKQAKLMGMYTNTTDINKEAPKITIVEKTSGLAVIDGGRTDKKVDGK